MKQGMILSLLLGMTVLVGCQTYSENTLNGLGSREGATMGNAIGRPIGSDERAAMGAFGRATRVVVGETVYWQNGRTGHWGSYCPIRDGHTGYQGDYCREFVTQRCLNGQIERVYGTACRRPNGTWYNI